MYNARGSMPELPQAFARFEIIRMLGKGGMGSVYLARDQRLGRQVALKVLSAEDLALPDRRSRFFREARTAAAIRHPNVATIYEVDETDEGQPFIVMEYCEGETLAQRMRRRPIDAGEFLSIARQIASGLSSAHDVGVVHRDIKAANIMIEPTGIVKILDFGLAKLLMRESTGLAAGSFESTSGHFFGTLHYLSPEQTRGEPADERSDLFSTGVVLYQMASGHLPFNADMPLMVLDRIRDTEPEPFTPLDPAFPAPAARVIGRLLQKKPADRYQSAQELITDLDAIDTPTLRVSSHLSRSMIGRTMGRPRWMQISAIVLLLLAGAAAIYFVRQKNHGATSAETTTAKPPPNTPIRSMAVMPLDNLANNQKDDFLSVGLADALVTKLQTIPSLQVRPTSAVLQYHDKKIDAGTASKELQVDGVLEGHFLAAGDLVRVNLQLTDARSGYSVWADSIDGKRTNLLKLIDDVSERTVNGLNEKLGVQDVGNASSAPRSKNPKAYEDYLRARALNGSLVPAEFNTQVNSLKHAIELDPTFAAAYADLSLALSLGAARGLVSDPNALSKAEWYARQAIRLDPNLSQAHLALGRVFVRFPDRFRESVRENLAAIRLNANDAQALWTLTTYFVSTGDLQKAQCVGDRLVRLDPSSNDAKTRGYWYVNAVDPEGALRNSDAALAAKDTQLAGHDIRGIAYLLSGNADAAQHEADAAASLVPKHYIGKSLHAMVAAARGDRAAAEQAIKSFQDDANRNHWAAIRIAMCYAKLGDRDQALHWINRSVELGHHSWYELVKHPWFQSLQTDSEFQQVVAKIKTDLDDVRDDVVGVYQLLCR
jgi:serine/threonine protein kinase/tetratricopeptide (TPR) repeat protein